MIDVSEEIVSKLDEILESDALSAAVERLAAVPDSKPSEYLTVAEAAKEFSIHPHTLYRLKRLHVRVGKSIRIRRAALENRDKLK
jgi:excisionase family DNA binding protein